MGLAVMLRRPATGRQRTGDGARAPAVSPLARRGEMRFRAGRGKSLPGGGRYDPNEEKAEWDRGKSRLRRQ